ncbi:MAG TPA: GGDEF domain-containing protein [Acidimicrobiales bacterium]|nr:GGDEF domain-containing protein [Acidimicrobiales bacterium]
MAISVTTVTDDDRLASLTLAYQLIHDLQAGVPGASEELALLAERARRRGWGEVARSCLFGEAVRAWIVGDGRSPEAVGKLIAASEESADEVMLALGLAMRSDQGFSGDDLTTSASRDADLAHAIVLLEQSSGHPLERISAHTACAIALGNRWLFELSHEQYEKALAVGAAEPPGSLDFLLAPILFNLAEEEVSWSGVLRQLDDAPGVAERFKGWETTLATAGTYPMADSWRLELDALGLLLGAIAGHDTAEEARDVLARVGTPDEGEPRAVGLCRLAIALSDADAGRPGAAGAAEAAVSCLSPEIHPFPYDLALFLAATIEARGGSGAGLRYARRAVEEQWARRQASLASMRAHIEAERHASERELLTRHARLDDLTGIGNRRALEEYVGRLAERSSATAALILFDVDAFKAINDNFGHLAGDAVLVRIGRVLERGVRPLDLAVRLGGDEFVVVLAETDLPAAATRAEALLATLDAQPMADLGEGLVLRVSAGVAAGPPARMIEVRAAADAALYCAKGAGGHRVAIGEGPTGRP